MIISEFFDYFEEKYNVKISKIQKQIFIQTIIEKKPVFIDGMRNGKTLLIQMIEEYKQMDKMEKGDKDESI